MVKENKEPENSVFSFSTYEEFFESFCEIDISEPAIKRIPDLNLENYQKILSAKKNSKKIQKIYSKLCLGYDATNSQIDTLLIQCIEHLSKKILSTAKKSTSLSEKVSKRLFQFLKNSEILMTKEMNLEISDLILACLSNVFSLSLTNLTTNLIKLFCKTCIIKGKTSHLQPLLSYKNLPIDLYSVILYNYLY